tara:strand:+ start:369 stop:560 length:192 start_codon:yes stop_codon:yes gene_type:complete
LGHKKTVSRKDQETRLLSAHIDLETHYLVRIEAAKLDMTISEYLRHLLDQELVEERKKLDRNK